MRDDYRKKPTAKEEEVSADSEQQQEGKESNIELVGDEEAQLSLVQYNNVDELDPF